MENPELSEGRDEDPPLQEGNHFVQEALQDDRIYPVFQAQQHIDSNTEIVGVESLLRGKDEDGKVVFPVTLIQQAQQEHLMVEVHRHVTKLSCAFAKKHDITLSINLHPDVLRNSDFDEDILDILSQTGLPPEQLMVELLENTPIKDLQMARKRLRVLFGKEQRKGGNGECIKGIKGAADDLPEGSSEGVLNQLKKLDKADEVKVDWKYVHDVDHPHKMRNGQAKKTIAQIIELARTSNAKVVFEGVEPGQMELREELAKLYPKMRKNMYVQIGKPEEAQVMAEILKGVRPLRGFHE